MATIYKLRTIFMRLKWVFIFIFNNLSIAITIRHCTRESLEGCVCFCMRSPLSHIFVCSMDWEPYFEMCVWNSIGIIARVWIQNCDGAYSAKHSYTYTEQHRERERRFIHKQTFHFHTNVKCMRNIKFEHVILIWTLTLPNDIATFSSMCCYILIVSAINI